MHTTIIIISALTFAVWTMLGSRWLITQGIKNEALIRHINRGSGMTPRTFKWILFLCGPAIWIVAAIFWWAKVKTAK